MKDEKYLFISDVKTKSNISRSAKHRRTHTGKRGGVKLPSDYLTKKELQKMNGECKSYRLNEPMKWSEYKQLPDDLKEAYLKAVIKTYNPSASAFAKMFDIERSTLQRELTRFKISTGSRGKAWDKENFLVWAYGVPSSKEEESAEEEPVVEEVFPPKSIVLDESKIIERLSDKEELVYPRAIPNTGNMVFEGNADSILKTLGVLFGDAKVHFSITWDVLD